MMMVLLLHVVLVDDRKCDLGGMGASLGLSKAA
jgi:hypothetical protein